MISYAQFVMRCLLKGVKGFGPSDPQERELLDLAAKWRDGKCSPTKGTLARMQNGEYGEAGRFAEALSRAMNEHDDDTALELLLEAFNSPLPAYLKIVGKVDRDILRFLKTGECGQYLMPQLKAIVKDPSNMDVKDYCILLLYSFALFDACPDVGGRPFLDIFKCEADSLVKSFEKCISRAFRKKYTIIRLAKKLFPHRDGADASKNDWDASENDWDASKNDWDAYKKPTRFVAPDFLRRIADIWFDDVLLPGLKDKLQSVRDESEQKEMLESYKKDIENGYRFVGAYALIMDRVKEKHKIDFRDLASKHYDAFLKEAEALYEISDKT